MCSGNTDSIERENGEVKTERGGKNTVPQTVQTGVGNWGSGKSIALI